MSVFINKRKLRPEEINLLTEEIKKFPNPVFITKKRWQKFDFVYVATKNKELIGICAITKTNNWIKLGPFILMQKYQGQGYGKIIVNHIVKNNPNNNFFIGSRNPTVHKIALDLGFKEELSFWQLSKEIKITLLDQLLESLNIVYLKELIRKRSIQQGAYRYFTKKLKVIQKV